MKIQALHEFHDPSYAEAWSNKWLPTKHRLSLFASILDEIRMLNDPIHVLELGVGPGYLAEFLLKRLPGITYEGVDFSAPMLEIAANRIKEHQERSSFTRADITRRYWYEEIRHPDVVVTTWTLHDLCNKSNISLVYRDVYRILPFAGLFLNGDFIKPEDSLIEYEGGRIRPSEHLKLLEETGFTSALHLKEFEKDVSKPTTANNYGLFRAIK